MELESAAEEVEGKDGHVAGEVAWGEEGVPELEQAPAEEEHVAVDPKRVPCPCTAQPSPRSGSRTGGAHQRNGRAKQTGATTKKRNERRVIIHRNKTRKETTPFKK